MPCAHDPSNMQVKTKEVEIYQRSKTGRSDKWQNTLIVMLPEILSSCARQLKDRYIAAGSGNEDAVSYIRARFRTLQTKSK